MGLDDYNSQRNLSTQGINESYEIGKAFASKDIPVDKIIVSEYCRSWKKANFAFGEWTQKDSRLNFLPYENYAEDHLALMKKNVIPLLTRPLLPGTNTIIISSMIFLRPQQVFILNPRHRLYPPSRREK